MGQDRIKSWVLSNQSKSKLIKYIRWFRTWCCCFCLCLPNKPTIMKILYIYIYIYMYIYITYVTSLRIKTKSGKTDKNQKSSSFPVLWWFRFLKPVHGHNRIEVHMVRKQQLLSICAPPQNPKRVSELDTASQDIDASTK